MIRIILMLAMNVMTHFCMLHFQDSFLSAMLDLNVLCECSVNAPLINLNARVKLCESWMFRETYVNHECSVINVRMLNAW